MTGVVEIAPDERITSVELLERATTLSYFELWNWALDNASGVLRTYMRNHPHHRPDFWIVREIWRSHYGSRPTYTDLRQVVILPAATLALKLLFVHVSLKDSMKVAFTPSANYGCADRQVVTTFGRFLTKYYPATYNELAVRELTTTYRYIHGTEDVKWAQTGEEIERVFRNAAVTSCMTHPVDHYDTGGIHPVRAYAGPDTRIAYLERDERIVSRTVVFERKKIWVRLFGDDLLRVKLEKLGYTHDSLHGARLERIPIGKHRDALLCPYLDGNVQRVKDNGTYLVVDMNGDMTCSERGWVSDNETDGTCRDCSNEVDDDDLTFLDFYEESVCNDCLENYVEANYSRPNRLEFGWIYGEDTTRYDDIYGHEVLVASNHSGRTLRLMSYAILSECFYSEYTVHPLENTVETEGGEIIMDDDKVETVNGSIFHADECVELPVEHGNGWVYQGDDLSDWLIDTQEKVFVLIDNVAEDDLNTIPVRQWLYWSLCFMPQADVVKVMKSMFSDTKLQELLLRVMLNVLSCEPLLKNGPVQENLFREAA